MKKHFLFTLIVSSIAFLTFQNEGRATTPEESDPAEELGITHYGSNCQKWLSRLVAGVPSFMMSPGVDQPKPKSFIVVLAKVKHEMGYLVGIAPFHQGHEKLMATMFQLGFENGTEVPSKFVNEFVTQGELITLNNTGEPDFGLIAGANDTSGFWSQIKDKPDLLVPAGDRPGYTVLNSIESLKQVLKLYAKDLLILDPAPEFKAWSGKKDEHFDKRLSKAKSPEEKRALLVHDFEGTLNALKNSLGVFQKQNKAGIIVDTRNLEDRDVRKLLEEISGINDFLELTLQYGEDNEIFKEIIDLHTSLEIGGYLPDRMYERLLKFLYPNMLSELDRLFSYAIFRIGPAARIPLAMQKSENGGTATAGPIPQATPSEAVTTGSETQPPQVAPTAVMANPPKILPVIRRPDPHYFPRTIDFSKERVEAEKKGKPGPDERTVRAVPGRDADRRGPGRGGPEQMRGRRGDGPDQRRRD